jgi:hypothetical protein
MKTKLDEWNSEISKLEVKARQKEAEARQDYDQRIEALKAKRQEVNASLDQMRQASEAAWKDLKAGIDLAANALGEALRSAASRF